MSLKDLISQAYLEDLPRGDVTTDSLGLAPVKGDAKLIAKEDLVLAGQQVFEACVRHIQASMELHWQFQDGEFILNQQVVCWIRGDLLQLLRAERVALNFLGRLSGIATLTRCFVQETRGTKCRILDTRKTTPLLRELEKMAVRCGGGHNHRLNLSDAVLVKENHIRAIGGIRRAIHAIRKAHAGPIEVECRTLEEVEVAVSERVQRILLDNMSTEMMRSARARIPAVIQVEASGNMTVERVREVAELGVDDISVGALTHSAPCADFSLMFEWQSRE
ncbi:MAG: carboxylating nicotinate-nucleotide diphosphorylase [Bdellovibrionales bacterium]